MECKVINYVPTYYEFILRLIFCMVYFAALPSGVYAQDPSANHYFYIGKEKSRNLDYSEAIDAFEQAIKISPDFAEAYLKLGNVYYIIHRYTDAADAYKMAVIKNPELLDASINLGAVSSMLSRYDDAITAFENALKLDPDNAEIYYNYGNVYTEQKKYKLAVNAYKKTLNIEPQFADAHYNLGIALLNLGEIKSAKKEYMILRKINKELAKDLAILLKAEEDE